MEESTKDKAYLNITHNCSTTRAYYIDNAYFIYTATPDAIIPIQNKSARFMADYLFDILNRDMNSVDLFLAYPSTWNMKKKEKVKILLKSDEFSKKRILEFLLLLI